MNLQESIRRILREDKDHTNLLKGIIDSSDIFDYKHFCGFDIITPEERSDQYNFLNKNKIPYLIKVYFVGGPNSEVWPRTQAVRNKELDLMEDLHEYIKSFVPFNIEMMGSHVNSCDGYKKLMKRKYSTDDLQESIKRILREEDYSPAGKEITPNKIVIHKSNPMFRDKIMENGLKIRAGECYKIYVGYGVKCKPAIFATNSTNKRAWFDSTYDDDIWEINTEMIPDVKWYKDRHFESRSKHIVTFQDIPKEALTLKYEGTGSGDVKKWDKDSPNLFESIRRILRESVPSQVRRRQEEFDRIFLHYRDSFIGHEYKSFKSFWNVTFEATMETLYHALFSKTVKDDDWEESAEYIENHLIKKYKDETKQMWEKKHHKGLNESKTSQHLKLMNNILDPFKEEDCLCDIKVSFDVEENNYDVYLVFSQKELRDKFSDIYGIRGWIREMQDDVKKDFEAFLPLRNIFIGYYTIPHCGWSPLNESDESKQERKFTKLLNNIEEYLNSNSYNSVVRFMVDYDEVMDDVIVNIFIDAEHAVKLGGGINSVIKKTGKKIMEDLSVFPFDFKYHIHFERPQLNESETKTNSSLHKLLNMLFDGFDDIYYDWANYGCGMGECCDPYAIGFTLPNKDYDDYIFKLVDGEMYDDDGDYPKELMDDLPEPCYQQPDIKDPKFDTIVFYGLYAEEIEDYMGHAHNWNLDLLKIINKQFGCEAKRIVII